MKKLIFLTILIVIGCQSNKQETRKNTISIRETESTFNLKLIQPRLLRLEPNSFAQISGIDKVLYFENRIIVLDKIKGNSIFIYDIKGKFINHINRVGEGPGEYRNVENIFWDSFSNELVLIPMDFRKKLYFDRDGNFVREVFYDEEIVYSDLVFLENGELIVNNSMMNLESNIAIYKDGKLVLSAIPFDDKFDDSPLNKRSLISRIDKEDYLLSLGLRDSLFKVNIDRNKVETVYSLDFQNEISFPEFAEHSDPIQYFMNNDFYLGCIDLFQNQDFLSFSTLHSTGLKGRIYSKNKSESYSTIELIQQKAGQLGFEGILGITPKNEFIAVISCGESGIWDFSLNSSLKKQFDDFDQVDKEELILMFFDLKESA